MFFVVINEEKLPIVLLIPKLNFLQAACEKVYVKIRQKKESSAAPQAVSLCKQAPDERNPVEVDQSGDVTQTQHNSKGRPNYSDNTWEHTF